MSLMNEFSDVHVKTIQFKLMLAVFGFINTKNLVFIELCFSLVYYVEKLQPTKDSITD